VAGSTAGAVLLGSSQFKKALASIESEKDPDVPRWAMVVDVDKCTECMKDLIAKTGNPEVKPPCAVACDRENNVPEFEDPLRDPQWLKILELEPEMGGDSFYMPIMCNHCEDPPCAQVCLTKATFKRADGILMIDYHRCIGCRYCVIACPYGARSFNWYDPLEGLKEINPETERRGHGVVEKCHFCVHRVDKAVREGVNPIPACVEACEKRSEELGFGTSLIFGNVKDPNSEISKFLRETRVIQLRAELGTKPHVFYKLE